MQDTEKTTDPVNTAPEQNQPAFSSEKAKGPGEETGKEHSRNTGTKKKHRKVRKGRMILLVVILLVTALVSASYLKYHELHSMLQNLPGGLGSVFEEKDGGTESSEQDKANLEESLKANLDKRKDSSDLSDNLMNILIVGVDARDKTFEGRSDAMVLCSINETDDHILMTSLLRDTYVAIPGYGSNRLNAAFAYGGADLLSKTIQQNFGITVDRTVVVNFIFVKNFVDAINGIDLDLTTEEIEVMNHYISDMNLETFKEPLGNDQLTDTSPGNYHLNGKQALAYARDRYSTGSDFDRTSRQRLVIETCLNKVKTMSLTQMNSLMNEFLPQIATDLSESDCAKLLLMLLQVSNYKVDSMSIPVEGTYQALTVNGMSVLGIDFDKNYEYWKEALKGNMPDTSPSPSASASAQALPEVEIADYSKVPAKTNVALQNQAIAEAYAEYYDTKVQYIVDTSKQGIFQFYDSSNTMLYPGDTVGKGVIIRYYTSE